MHRRELLSWSSLLLFETRFAFARASQAQNAIKGSDLTEELSTSEMEIMNKSAMAKDIDNFYGKGFS
jgi:hypothetical protein